MMLALFLVTPWASPIHYPFRTYRVWEIFQFLWELFRSIGLRVTIDEVLALAELLQKSNTDEIRRFFYDFIRKRLGQKVPHFPEAFPQEGKSDPSIAEKVPSSPTVFSAPLRVHYSS